MNAEAQRMYHQSLPLLDQVAKWMGRRLGNVIPFEDVKAHAHDGLLDGVQTYDPERSSLSTYLSRKMRWAILDGVRRETRSRRVLSQATAMMASERISLDTEVSPDEPGSTEEQHVEALDQLLQKHAAAMVVGLVGGGASIEDPDDTPEERTSRAQLLHVVRTAIRTLSDRERQLLERHYFEGEEFDAIAADLGISKSWASRLHAQAIEKLGQMMREQNEKASDEP